MKHTAHNNLFPFFFIFFLLLLLLGPATTTNNNNNENNSSHISLVISTKGLNFVKELLISKAITSLTPLYIPHIQQSKKIPFIGNVFIELSNVTLQHIQVSNSSIKPSDSAGVAILVSGATANLTLDWYYSYFSGFFFPLQLSDRGLASIQVDGIQVGLTLGLENQQGKLNISLLECGCFVEDLTIKLDGGASWLYQWFVDIFVERIESAVEEAITQKLREATSTLDSSLQSLPKEIPIDDVASLNVSFVDEPVLTNASIGLQISGLFAASDRTWEPKAHEQHLKTFSCDDPLKMIGISIDEAVFLSASDLYFETGYLQWIVDKIPDQHLLNTGGWRLIIPQLYKKYPNDDMNMNVSLTRPPAIRISPKSIQVTVNAQLTINVLEGGEVIPVVCISLEIQASGSISMRGNTLGGKVKLDDFQMTLEWSKVGNLKMFLIKPAIWTVIETVLLPYTNIRLLKGFPLPMIRGFTLINAKIRYLDSGLVICSDVAYSDDNAHALVRV
ncbi:putative BPI/LBP family protein At1g04970 [Silene latifolia]|uniref:putative BPI/LBP family protein At1g04970 n=1 Tax=Silene latifolia TaxID=37657 RepID=UPI003D7885F0